MKFLKILPAVVEKCLLFGRKYGIIGVSITEKGEKHMIYKDFQGMKLSALGLGTMRWFRAWGRQGRGH